MVWNDPAEEVLASQRRSWPTWLRRSLWALFSILVLVVVWGGYRWWVYSQVDGYAAACERAQRLQAWPALQENAVAWARWEPGNAQPWRYAAEASRRQGEALRAADYLKQVPAQATDAVAAMLELSDLQFNELNRPLDGEATCREILRREPSHAEAHRRLVFFYAMTLQRTKLIKQARAAIRLDCASPEVYVYLIGADWLNFSNAQRLNEFWLQADPDNADFLVARVIHFLGSQGVLDDILGVESNAKPIPATAEQKAMLKGLDSCFRRFPQQPEMLAYFLRQGCKGGDRAKVAKLLGQSPPEAAEDNRFWRFKGWLQAAQDEFADAEAAYRRALQLHPFDWQSQHELASILRRLQRYDEVAKWQQLALEGKQIGKQVFALPNMQSAPKMLLRRIAKYARACGDPDVADHLMLRVSSLP